MRLIVLAVLMLVSCSDPAAEAKKELEIVENSGDPREICEASRKLAQAHLKAGAEAEYRQADTSADISCRRADQEGY